MKFKLGLTRNVGEVLNEILFPVKIVDGKPVRQSSKLPAKTAYWLSRFIEKTQNELGHFEKSRHDLCLKHCRKDESGNCIMLTNAAGVEEYDIVDKEAFEAEFADLANLEVEIPFRPLTLDQLEAIDIQVDHMGVLRAAGIVEELEI